jgi:hypothetical protein
MSLKTFSGKFVKNDELPSGPEYYFNTEEEIKIGKAYIFIEYGHPIYVIDILPKVKKLITLLSGKEVPLRTVTLRKDDNQ